MDRRTFEGPMEWEYQDTGPVDPTSPFALAARSSSQNVFTSPARPFGGTNRTNPFTPSKTQQFSKSSSTRFAPPSSAKPAASPFRNPAFTTPQKPFNDSVLSEASGPEDSPGMTENSDVPNDTPELDRSHDVNMGGVLVPAKIDKSFRYSKSGPSSRRHMPGKGEIKAHRDPSVAELRRRRKKHGHDREVASIVRHGVDWQHDSDAESDASYSARAYARGSHRSERESRDQGGGMLRSLFRMMDEHPNAPENIYRWIQLAINMFIGGVFLYGVWVVVAAARADIHTANAAERIRLVGNSNKCRDEFEANGCSTTVAPRLQELCAEWADCMNQNTKAVMSLKVTIREIAAIVNVFFETMNFKAMGAFIAILFVVIVANNATFGRAGRTHHPPPMPTPSHSAPGASAHPDGTASFMWVPVQTPNMKRHGIMNEDTDTDSSPPKMSHMLPPYTPSRRASPSKTERSLSPVKYSRSPSKWQ